MLVSLFAQGVQPVSSWPSHEELLALAQRARIALDRRALCIVHHHIDDVTWREDEALPRFLTLLRLAFATISIEGEEEGMIALQRAAAAARGVAWAYPYVEALKSRVYYASGERIAARTHLESALHDLERVDPDTVCPEAWLALAEASLPFDVDVARDAVRNSETTQAASHDEPITLSHRMVIRGRIDEALGLRTEAETHYRMAFDVCRACGDVRTAMVVAAHLGSLTGDRAAWAYARENARVFDPTWWPLRALAAEDARRAFPLTPAQSEVLARIRAGASNKGIAAETGRSVSRVRDIVAELFDIFAVQPRTRAALVSTANGYE